MATGGKERNNVRGDGFEQIAPDDEESAHLIDENNKDNSKTYDSTSNKNQISKPMSSSIGDDNRTIQ